ncbi:MAG: hypothetical protein AB2693_00860 [Candidatus Thiodiazotropha sp.]
MFTASFFPLRQRLDALFEAAFSAFVEPLIGPHPPPSKQHGG